MPLGWDFGVLGGQNLFYPNMAMWRIVYNGRVQSFIMHSIHNFQLDNVYFTVSFGWMKPICIIISLCFAC